eukprot:3837040-Rhodomonas_salina.1
MSRDSETCCTVTRQIVRGIISENIGAYLPYRDYGVGPYLLTRCLPLPMRAAVPHGFNRCALAPLLTHTRWARDCAGSAGNIQGCDEPVSQPLLLQFAEHVTESARDVRGQVNFRGYTCTSGEDLSHCSLSVQMQLS